MADNKPIWQIPAVILTVIAVILLSVRLSQCKRGDDSVEVKESVESQITHDTVYVRDPIAATDTIIRYVSIPLPTSTIRHDTVSVVETDTICIVGDTLQLPISQKVYRDSNYVAYVSGYQPALDSILVINRTITNTITRTEFKKRSRWNVGITAGYGYGIQHGHFEPFIGVGVTYNIFR